MVVNFVQTLFEKGKHVVAYGRAKTSQPVHVVRQIRILVGRYESHYVFFLIYSVHLSFSNL